jgi:membrane protease YdiL (CAAX protease family)
MVEKARAYAFHRYLAFPAAGEEERQAYYSATAGVIAHTGIAIEGLLFLLFLVLGLLAALVSGWRATAVGDHEGRPGFLAARPWIAVLVVTPWLVTLLGSMVLAAIHGPWMPSLFRGVTVTGALLAFVAAPVAEEVFWRRWFTTALGRHLPTWLALVVPAAMFTLSHDVDSPRALIQMFLVSLALGLLWLRSRSVLLCALSHAGVNVIAIALSPHLP